MRKIKIRLANADPDSRLFWIFTLFLVALGIVLAWTLTALIMCGGISLLR